MKYISILLILLFFACGTESEQHIKIEVKNNGPQPLNAFYLKVDELQYNLGDININYSKEISLDKMENIKIRYGFKNDFDIRSKMGGDLYFENVLENQNGKIVITLENGLVHEMSSFPVL